MIDKNIRDEITKLMHKLREDVYTVFDSLNRAKNADCLSVTESYLLVAQQYAKEADETRRKINRIFEKVLSEHPDICLLDYVLPKLDF